jgi:imidazolonepropionase-like amidohydrolase
MLRRLLHCLIGAALLAATGCAQRRIEALPGEPVTAFVGVTVLTMDGRRPLADQTVAVRGERILALGPRRSIALPQGVAIIDGRGRFLMPGLADMHVHLGTPDDGLLFLAHGVTSVRDMWGNERTMKIAASFASAEVPGPRVYSAGPLIDGPGSFWEWAGPPIAATPEEARRHVAASAGQGFKAVKLYDKLSPKAFRAAAAEARTRGMQVYAHVPNAMTLAEVLDVGVDSIEHFEGAGVALADNWTDDSFAGSKLVWAQARSERMDALARLFAAKRVWNAPTLVVYTNPARAFADLARAEAEPEMRYISHRTVAYWRDARKNAPTDEASLRAIEAGHLMRLKLVRAAFDAGAPLLIGTDTPNPFVLPGISLHQEIGYFRDVGLTPAQVIRIATAEAARFLGQTGEFGAVRAGARADLLLLDRDPEQDLSALLRPAGVMAAGRWYDRATLDAQLEALAERTAEARRTSAG